MFQNAPSSHLRSSPPDDSISTAAATSPLASYNARRASPAGNPISVSVASPSGSVAGDREESPFPEEAATAAAVVAVTAAVTGTSIDSIGPVSLSSRADDRRSAGVWPMRDAAAAAADAAGVAPGLA